MTLGNRGEPSGFANLAAPLMSMQVRRVTSRNLALLKTILERDDLDPATETRARAKAQ